MTRGGIIPRCAEEQPGAATVAKAAANKAVAIRMSVSQGALPIGADDLPVAAVLTSSSSKR